MGRRQRRRRRASGSTDAPATATDYQDPDGNVLKLRDSLSGGTLDKLRKLDARPAESQEDRWQRRTEFLFERLVVSWEIAGLPLEGQKELLGRYRMASADERRWVAKTLEEHLTRAHPEAQ